MSIPLLKKCRKCGGDDFIIEEKVFHEACLSPEDGDLSVYKEIAGGIERIFCKICDEVYLEVEFKEINFM